MSQITLYQHRGVWGLPSLCPADTQVQVHPAAAHGAKFLRMHAAGFVQVNASSIIAIKLTQPILRCRPTCSSPGWSTRQSSWALPRNRRQVWTAHIASYVPACFSNRDTGKPGCTSLYQYVSSAPKQHVTPSTVAASSFLRPATLQAEITVCSWLAGEDGHDHQRRNLDNVLYCSFDRQSSCRFWSTARSCRAAETTAVGHDHRQVVFDVGLLVDVLSCGHQQSSCRPWSTARSCRAERTARRCPPRSTRPRACCCGT